MSRARPGVLRVGSRVRLDGRIQTVVGLSGTAVRLASQDGDPSVIQLAHLQSGPGFEVIDQSGRPARRLSAAAMAGVPAEAAEEALRWERTSWRCSPAPARTHPMVQAALPNLAIGYGPLDDDHTNGSGFPQRKADDGPPCHFCVLARGITMPVRCWKHPEDVICLRHRRWIGLGADTVQPDLTGQPEILHAHKRHLRLVRHHGRDPVAFSFAVADHICRTWHERRQHDAGFCERMRIFHGPDWQAPPASATVAAAIYPQAVPLTRLLVSPYWQALSSPAQSRRQELFIAEVRRTVASGYRWPQAFRSGDPLDSWITGHNLPGHHPALFRYHSWPALPA